MEVLNVLVAALGAFAFAAVWYMSMSKAWVAAAEVKVDEKGNPTRSDGSMGSSPMPYVIGLVAMVIVAGMMRHIFAGAGIDTLGGGIVGGLGVGAFLITPWMAMNYAFSMRKPALTVIDGTNSVIGCGIMGLILALF
jgi:Protein of unknown function (DUF1761)